MLSASNLDRIGPSVPVQCQLQGMWCLLWQYSSGTLSLLKATLRLQSVEITRRLQRERWIIYCD